MIRYQLRCDKAHGFESWFRNSAAYDALAAVGEVACPVCDSTRVEKQLMAPAIAKPSETAPAAGSDPAPAMAIAGAGSLPAAGAVSDGFAMAGAISCFSTLVLSQTGQATSPTAASAS